MKIAAILDPIYFENFSHEADLTALYPGDVEAQLDRIQPDILFMNSCWRGNAGQWQGVTSFNLSSITRVVDWCQHKGIPTVFWCTEDPPHNNRFSEVAALFEYVFTTDSDSIVKYENLPKRRPEGYDYRIKKVNTLMFATQPKIFYDRNLKYRLTNITFAGSWYGDQYKERSAFLDSVLTVSAEYGLELYDRNKGRSYGTPKTFPFKFSPYTKPGVPYEETARLWNNTVIAVNANSIINSPTMFANRVPDMLACGAVVMTNPTKAMENLFGHVVLQPTSQEEARQMIEHTLKCDAFRSTRKLLGKQLVGDMHTYKHRLDFIKQVIGI